MLFFHELCLPGYKKIRLILIPTRVPKSEKFLPGNGTILSLPSAYIVDNQTFKYWQANGFYLPKPHLMKIINSILEALNDYLNHDNSENQYGQGLIFVPIPERSELEKRIHDAGRR